MEKRYTSEQVCVTSLYVYTDTQAYAELIKHCSVSLFLFCFVICINGKNMASDNKPTDNWKWPDIKGFWKLIKYFPVLERVWSFSSSEFQIHLWRHSNFFGYTGPKR